MYSVKPNTYKPVLEKQKAHRQGRWANLIFHNGIILIVICLKFIANIQKKYDTHNIFLLFYRIFAKTT